MVILHRAVQAEDKAARRATILQAAEALIAGDPENFASVAQVAEAAGLAKGTVYLYFRSKEEMVLAVHAQHTARMFDLLGDLLAANLGRPMQARQVVDSFCAFATDNPLFLHLGAACHSSFERNIDPEVMYQFRTTVAARLAHFGPLIEACFPALAPGGGIAVLHATYAFALGMWQLCDPTHKEAKGIGKRPGLEVFDRDFRADLHHGLLALWQGYMRSPDGDAA